jgi:hypothetical protein
MGLFVVKEETKKQIHIYQKDFVNLKSAIGYVIFLILIPLIGRLFLESTSLLLVLFVMYFLTIILGCWFAFEKAYYSSTFPKRFMKEGKKVKYEKKGVKIFK